MKRKMYLVLSLLLTFSLAVCGTGRKKTYAEEAGTEKEGAFFSYEGNGQRRMTAVIPCM